MTSSQTKFGKNLALYSLYSHTMRIFFFFFFGVGLNSNIMGPMGKESLIKEFKKTQIKGKTSCMYGLEELILLKLRLPRWC